MTEPVIPRRCCGPANCGRGETVFESEATPRVSRWINWCIGPRCMAWRHLDNIPFQPDAGYCGLAGKPNEANDRVEISNKDEGDDDRASVSAPPAPPDARDEHIVALERLVADLRANANAQHERICALVHERAILASRIDRLPMHGGHQLWGSLFGEIIGYDDALIHTIEPFMLAFCRKLRDDLREPEFPNEAKRLRDPSPSPIVASLTPARIAELRALAEKATEGQWRYERSKFRSCGYVVTSFVGVAYEVRREEDAAFIAAADPPTIVAALDEIERLRAENDGLREAFAIVMRQKDASDDDADKKLVWKLSGSAEIEQLRAEHDRSRACCDELREVTLPDAVRAMRAENERLREALTKIVRTEVTGLGDTLVAVLRECRSIARRALEGGAS